MEDSGKVSGSAAGPATFGVDVEKLLISRGLENLVIAGVRPGMWLREGV